MLIPCHEYGMALKGKERYHQKLWRFQADSFSKAMSAYLIVIMINQKQKITATIRDAIVIVFLLFGGAYFIYIAGHGFLTNQAATIGKDSSWLSRDDYPKFFWISIIFHATAGFFAVLNGAKMVARIFNANNKNK